MVKQARQIETPIADPLEDLSLDDLKVLVYDRLVAIEQHQAKATEFQKEIAHIHTFIQKKQAG